MLSFLRLALGIAALAIVACGTASAQYPTRPVRLVVGFAAGGPTDIFARRIAQTLSEKLGQQLIIENKPGATGNIATEYVINQPPDGHTLLVAATSNAINMTFHSKLSFNFLRDVQPVAGLARINYIVALNPIGTGKDRRGVHRLREGQPGQDKFRVGRHRLVEPALAEMFKVLTGTKLVHVPYRGNAAAYADVISGQVQLIFADVGSVRPHVQSGALRAHRGDVGQAHARDFPTCRRSPRPCRGTRRMRGTVRRAEGHTRRHRGKAQSRRSMRG